MKRQFNYRSHLYDDATSCVLCEAINANEL